MTVFPALVVPKVPENLSNPKKMASLLLGRWVFTALIKLFIFFLLQGIPTHVLCSSHGQATVLALDVIRIGGGSKCFVRAANQLVYVNIVLNGGGEGTSIKRLVLIIFGGSRSFKRLAHIM